MPTDNLIYNIAMDADDIWDGVLERLKLQPAWLTIELCYSFLQCKFTLKVYYIGSGQNGTFNAHHTHTHVPSPRSR